MGSPLDKRRRRPPRSRTMLIPSAVGAQAGAAHEIRFVPARWLLLLLAIAGRVLAGGKLGIAGLIWAFMPRAVKIAAAGAAVAAAIVVAGALAAIALLVMQIG